jgi:outer membrane protein assembly factor BamB
MNLSTLCSKGSLVLTSVSLILSSACKKHSEPLPFTTPVALPAKNMTTTSFTADWVKNGSFSYNLYVATDSNFTNPLPGYNPMNVKPDSADITGLTPKTNYYYKVIGVDGKGDTTDPSKTIWAPTPDPNDDRFIYIGSEDEYFYCFYAGTGDKLWDLKTNGDVESSASLNGGALYFTGTDQRLYALDPVYGTKRWNYLCGSAILSSPCVGPDAIYFSSYTSGTIFAVNKNGSKKWSVKPTNNIRMLSSPVYNNGIIYVGSHDKNLYALNASTGATIWVAPTGDSVSSSPAVTNGTVYVGSSDHKVYAFDAGTGTVKWTYTTGDSVYSSPTISNGTVYVGSFDNGLYALDATTGAKKWRLATGGRVQSSPAVSNGIVYAGSFDNKLYAVDATTGAVKWSTATGGRIYSSPTVGGNGLVYVASYEGKLYAMDAATGAIKWVAATRGPIRLSSPTVLTFPGNIIMPGISGEVQ